MVDEDWINIIKTELFILGWLGTIFIMVGIGVLLSPIPTIYRLIGITFCSAIVIWIVDIGIKVKRYINKVSTQIEPGSE